MAMIKTREAYFCNLKLLLLFLVIVGHGIEPYTAEAGYVGTVHRIIYTVHMPLFAFVTGLFLKNGAACRKQAASGMVWYLGAQGIYLLFKFFVLHKTGSFVLPYWHLWYLLSLCWWSLIGGGVLWLRGKGVPLPLILCAAIIAACFCGTIPWVDRRLSLSRTVVFLPYVLLGQAVPTGFFRKLRPVYGILPLITFAVLYLTTGSRIFTAFFYQADAVGFAVWQEGAVNRLLCLVYALLLGGGILCVISGRRSVFTKIGASTMPAYLLHLAVLPLINAAVAAEPYYVLWSALFAALFLVSLFELTRWFQNCYAITQSRNRGYEKNRLPKKRAGEIL